MWTAPGEMKFKIVLYGVRDTTVRGSLRAIAEVVTGEPAAPVVPDEKFVTHDSIELSLPPIKGVKTSFLVMTAPAEEWNTAARLLLLKQTDGVIFIAAHDEDPAACRARLNELRSHLASHQYRWEDITVVLQSEGDTDGAHLGEAWGVPDRPLFTADTARRVRHMDALKAAMKLLLARARSGGG